jgi:hypothetical protein
MSQYANLFKSTRIPGLVRDELRTVQHASHVVVQRRGRFWKLDLLDKAGATVPLAQIEAALQAICDASDSSPAPPEEHVGLLTHLSRDQWAGLRTAIVASQPNAASLEAIDTALFALCLDVEAPKGACWPVRLPLMASDCI